MNTKCVLGLPRANQVGLEHAKKKPKEVGALARGPPLLGMSMLTDLTGFFFKASLTQIPISREC